VAIKSPILCLSDRHRLEGELTDFYTEAKVTSNFCHENILHCLGITQGLFEESETSGRFPGASFYPDLKFIHREKD
jgi:hypothetical protein